MKNNYDIKNVYKKLKIKESSIIPYGYDKAKIIETDYLDKPRKGNLILTTAMTPTKAGEGKTTTSIGLADGLSLLKKNVIACLREPSLGPVFGIKGGGTGGGKAKLYPEDDINLNFTGDIHALTTINNLLSALIDNELYFNTLDVDKDRIIFPRAMDMNDRSLRHILTSIGDKKVEPHQSSFVITAASEVMAIFCLCKDKEDFLNRIDEITLAYKKDGTPIKAKELQVRGAINKLIKDAIHPNLVQTLYKTPTIVHGGPFANIAHGCNSIIATDLSLKLADYVVTEAGFGSDLGMEKFLDIVCPLANINPSLIVMVASIRALKLHGGVAFENLDKENCKAIEIGFANLKKHLDNVSLYKIPYLVSINKFETDTAGEINTLINLLKENNIRYAINTSYIDGNIGAVDLAKEVVKTIDESANNFSPLIKSSDDLFTKIDKISKNIYGADSIIYQNNTEDTLKLYKEMGLDNYSICMSKVPTSLSDDPNLLDVPKHDIHIKDIRLFTGAKFIVPLTGDVFTMPGLPKVPQSKKM